MVINKFSKTGTYHRNINRENQDYVCNIEGKDFLAIMLADGATACENGFSYLLKPKRYEGNPCLTTTKGAVKAIDIAVCNLALGDSILICSDGFLDQMTRENIASLLNSYDIEGLNRKLSLIENEDDCSYISFTRERK